jgi:Chalcone isomerase-like
MSGSTRSCAPELKVIRTATRVARTLAVIAALPLALAFTAALAGDAPPLPAQVTSLAPNLHVQGGGELRFLGISVYDCYYWGSDRGWTHDGTYALDLHYHVSLNGARIAERSVSEIARLGYGTPEQRARWGEKMKGIFTNVDKDDRLTGINLPGGVVRYFHNGNAIGDIADPGFARAFFGIWLDPKTSESDFRQVLLGEKK